MYDLVIIGSGPAGLSAAIYAKRAKLNFIVIEKTGMSGGQVLSTYEVDNYPGMPGISGLELGQSMKEHADKLSVEFVDDEVIKVKKEEKSYSVICNDNVYEASGIIIATGARHMHLNVPGEEKLSGMGVSYCATCDGAFFADKDVCVVGGGDVAVEDAIFLARSCRKVYLIHRRDSLRATPILQETMKNTPNIVPVWNSTVASVNGTDMVESVTLYNKETGKESELAVSGIFIAVGIRPESDIFTDTIKMTENGYIEAGEDCRTNMERVYAVGDVRYKRLRQIITACADGANAVTSFQDDIM